MVFINYTAMQMTSKIVYYGPGLCGKTTNLQAIHEGTSPGSRGEMVSLETETDRTLFFDLLPLEVGIIGGMKVRLQLYTVPGQVFYNATRKLVLKGVDGVVFVADSQAPAFDANVESLTNLQANLAELRMSLDQLPLVLQYNKRDLRNILPVEKLNQALNDRAYPYFEAAALHGVGVFETLKAISRLAIADIRKKVAGDTAPRRRFGEPARAESKAQEAEPAPPALVEHPLEMLVSSPPEVQRIQGELQKLRASAAAPAPPPRPAIRVDISPGEGAREDVKRKATVEVPAPLLKDAGAVKVRLVFERGSSGEDVVADALTVNLAGNRRLERLNLHLDLEVKGKP
ncbi:MAG TPA: GTPase domain-containing protein [Vicinamibacteria bacterium]|nr:GTPase domain-containing protein [Vicinamibacteria bacterium]